MILLPDNSWEIKMTPLKGRGIFATKDIAPGKVIGDYIGRVIKTAEEDTSDKDGLYLMYYHDYASLYPTDINAPGIHLINHSCAPNCWLFTYKGHTLFFSLRKIFAGEELTASYLLSPNNGCMPCRHACICDTTYCSRTMHLSQEQFEQWNTFNENQAKKSKRARIRYGRELAKLAAYPDHIPDHPIYNIFGSLDADTLIFDSPTFPSIDEIRVAIRKHGRTLTLPKLKKKILGVKNNAVITESL